MFIKETGYIELICYAKYAGVDLDPEIYPQIQYSDEQIQQIIKENWNTEDAEYDRLMKIGKYFQLYPSEIYVIFLSVLPFWDSRFGNIFSLFGGIDGRATLVLARDMWEKNHKQQAICRENVMNRFFLEDDIVLQPKPHVLSYLCGIFPKNEDVSISDKEIISPRVNHIFQQTRHLKEPLLFYGQKGMGKKTCFLQLAKYRGLMPIFLVSDKNAEHQLFFAVAEQRAVGICDIDLLPIAQKYLTFLPFYIWIWEERPKELNASPVFFAPLSMEERYEFWTHAAENFIIEEDISFRVLANQYELTPGEILKCLSLAEKMRNVSGKSIIGRELLYDAVHDVLSHQFDSRAERVDCKYNWEDLVLPLRQKSKIMECCNQVSLRHVVLEKWNIRKNNMHDGITVLFYGPPGTGKTMAAQVIAARLGMELYKAELSTVVSKYIGETEKNLKQIFEDAKKSQAILFFDEADALFGKRTEVKDSHDKYSNMEAAFLLQEMERYNGVVILATNFVENIDEAFKRRMKFIIEFPFPSMQERKEIWQKAIPNEMPLDHDIDIDFLAEKFELTGSSIKNAVYSAAFLAASHEKPVGMKELILAVKGEYEKTGKIFSDTEAGIYAGYLH